MTRQVKDRRRDPDSFDPVQAVEAQLGIGRQKHSENRGKPKNQRHYTEKKTTTLSKASKRSTAVATRWIAAALEYGYEVPYNDVWLAHQITAKVVKDPLLKPMLEKGDHVKVQRLLDKMTDLYWSEYVDDAVTPKNASSVYFDEVWDDLREYARSCLRAAWLKEHGVPVEPPDYGDHRDQDLHKELQALKEAEFLERAKHETEPPPGRKLDPRHREMLRSLMTNQGGNE